MKALSIRQPWAWLIVMGYKDVENRKWSTQFRGKFLVHAGQKFDRAGYERVMSEMGLAMPEPREFERGGIVGVAEITDCVTEHDSPWFLGPYGFVLENARPLQFVPLRGKLGFFDVNEISTLFSNAQQRDHLKGGGMMEKKVGDVIDYDDRHGVAVVELCDDLRVGTCIRIKGPKSDWKQLVKSLYVDKKLVSKGVAGQIVWLEVIKRAHKGDWVLVEGEEEERKRKKKKEEEEQKKRKKKKKEEEEAEEPEEEKEEKQAKGEEEGEEEEEEPKPEPKPEPKRGREPDSYEFEIVAKRRKKKKRRWMQEKGGGMDG